jgi:hypothetical protein
MKSDAECDRHQHVRRWFAGRCFPGGLDLAAADAFRQWQFDPGRADGKAVAMIVVADLNFAMRP